MNRIVVYLPTLSYSQNSSGVYRTFYFQCSFNLFVSSLGRRWNIQLNEWMIREFSVILCRSSKLYSEKYCSIIADVSEMIDSWTLLIVLDSFSSGFIVTFDTYWKHVSTTFSMKEWEFGVHYDEFCNSTCTFSLDVIISIKQLWLKMNLCRSSFDLMQMTIIYRCIWTLRRFSCKKFEIFCGIFRIEIMFVEVEF